MRPGEMRREIIKPGVWINGTFFSLDNFKLRMVTWPRTKGVEAQKLKTRESQHYSKGRSR